MTNKIHTAIKNAKDTMELGKLVEAYLYSINEHLKATDESYEDTAGRFDDSGMEDAANVMTRASNKWFKLEQ
jgi:hypothetical protein